MGQKQTFFEKLFKSHVREMQDTYGEYKTGKYIEWADSVFYALLWLVGASLVVIIITSFGLSDLRSRTLSKFLVICLYLVVAGVIVLWQLRNLSEKFADRDDLAEKWKWAIVSCAILGFSASAWCVYVFFQSYHFVDPREKVELAEKIAGSGNNIKNGMADIKELGAKFTIPQGWSAIHWRDHSPAQENRRPHYSFYVECPKRLISVEMAGWRFRPGLGLAEVFKPSGYERMLDGGFVSDGRIVTRGNVAAYRIAGLKKSDLKNVYIMYSMLHYGTEISYVYRYDRSLNYLEQEKYYLEEELELADSFLENIEFYEPEGYVENKRRFPEDKRPSDYAVESSESVNIYAAKIEIPLPVSGQKVHWNERTRDRYNFDLTLNGYRIESDLILVYTSENATLLEWMGEFEENEGKKLDRGFVVAPQMKKLKNTSVLRVAGRSKDYADQVLVKYFMIHRGARLMLIAYVPQDLNLKSEMNRIESFINKIVFY